MVPKLGLGFIGLKPFQAVESEHANQVLTIGITTQKMDQMNNKSAPKDFQHGH